MNLPLSRKKDPPIIFVPGMFGSMGEKIIPGTGEWGFGIAKYIYQPFIHRLEKMGYQIGENLFIAHYDWRKPIESSTKEDLLPLIRQVQKETNTPQVNIVCHGMGGLLGRTYAQSKSYQNDVRQLIMIGTPNAGISSHFNYWTGSSLPNMERYTNFVHLYMELYLWLLEKSHEDLEPIQAIQSQFPSLGDTIPSRDYGDYLMSGTTKTSFKLKSYKKMKVKNKFLDYLNNKKYTLLERKIQVSLIAGIRKPTIGYLEVEKGHKRREWRDGKAVSHIHTEAGDGNVVTASAFNIQGEQYLLKGDHNEILIRSEPILREKLLANKAQEPMEWQEELWEDSIVVLIVGKGEIRKSNGNALKELEYHEDFHLQYVRLPERTMCLMVIGKDLSNIKFVYRAYGDETIEVNVKRKHQHSVENSYTLKENETIPLV